MRIKHEDNGVAPASSLLIVNIFETCSNCWLWTGKRLPRSYWKEKNFWRLYHAIYFSILKFINKWHLISSQPHRWIIFFEKFLRRSLLQTLILAKKMRLKFRLTCCIFVFFVILTRSYLTELILSCREKLLNYHHFQYGFTQMSGFSLVWITNSRMKISVLIG